MNPRLAASAALILGLLGTDALRAQTGQLWPRFAISAGAFDSSTKDEIGVEGEIGDAGDAVDVAATIGLPKSKTALTAELDWSFADRHSLELRYASLERRGSRRLIDEVKIGGRVFPIGADGRVSLTTTSLEAGYTYWLVRREHVGFGATIGLVELSVDAAASATAAVPGTSVTVTESASASTDLPVPMVGLAAKGQPWNRVVLYARGRFLPSVKVGRYDGEAGSFSVGTDVYLTRWFALGASYDGSYYRADVDDPEWRGSVDLQTEGFRLYLRAAF
jgi:hypothetical protein